ncbi:P-loop containing nucleoside triphosphate hydrolase protein [Kockovaella imperatae]|uniref:p-loop containing nucleoside triphosphate hydrolase protein n=1 Tax=Kockovaella imperatae TaxID=4999 RepID=A0A1Y1USI0_9TREE|nr:P-loop containing nucleoside triphosphate hydrolase protein [Kockovaella imperatae]ORX40980.1 P-loop containing nucleoside triphosphate hydrolase protein [Kockovaella imperatae]
MQDAVTRLDRAMRHSNAIARRWLFPQLEGASNPAQTLSHSPWDPSTLDATLNEEQMSAAIAIASRSHTIPYLISGPPGTGKTKTLVASILSILQVNPHAHIIACAPSNPAADTIVSRLIPRMNANQLLRLNPPNRTFAEVPDDVLRYCHVEGDAFGLPCYAKLMAFQVVVTTCQDAEILIRARATNLDTMATELAHGELFHPDQPLNILPHWTHLLVDEAGQASEPEIAIPLSVLLPPPTSLTSISDPVVVLCGDVHQLGPRVLSVAARTGELDVSLLERLFERPVYASHPMSRTSIRHRRANGASGASGAPGPPPFCDLVRNYRSLPEILMIPSTLFYEDTLVPAARDVGHLAWEGLPNPAMPIAFLGCDSEENWIEEGASWYNLGEIRMVVETVGSLLGNVPDLRQEQIAIITPWREQVWRLRAALRKATFFKVDVGNVENYQGREFRVTILSTVRGSKRFIQSDHQANMGVIFERKRFNVAITRAKDLLVIIGNAACLSLDPFWNQFLQFCLRNGLYKGPETGIKDTGACMSRLEIEMRMRNESDLDEEKNLTIANAVASLALETR